MQRIACAAVSAARAIRFCTVSREYGRTRVLCKYFPVTLFFKKKKKTLTSAAHRFREAKKKKKGKRSSEWREVYQEVQAVKSTPTVPSFSPSLRFFARDKKENHFAFAFFSQKDVTDLRRSSPAFFFPLSLSCFLQLGCQHR